MKKACPPVMLQEVLGAPECMSFVFNQDGKVSSFTGGYIMDRSAAARCTPCNCTIEMCHVTLGDCSEAHPCPGTAC